MRYWDFDALTRTDCEVLVYYNTSLFESQGDEEWAEAQTTKMFGTKVLGLLDEYGNEGYDWANVDGD